MPTDPIVDIRRVETLPRLPLEGSLDLTYRCNNRCLHCWLWEPDSARVAARELTFEEIRGVADEARSMGCRRWNISGGEPMLRPDFEEIFEYLTDRSMGGYSLNTNGTLITPEIARLLKRKGNKMVAVYGATAEVYDAVTRNPGGFEALMQGIAYLREAGAGFTVQLIPMRANWHQWDEMRRFAQELSPTWRVGAPWLFLSASGDEKRNAEIREQRLDPADVVALDPPKLAEDPAVGVASIATLGEVAVDELCGLPAPFDALYSSCFTDRSSFHVDAYGGLSWCLFMKDPALRCDLRETTFAEAWEQCLPRASTRVSGGDEYVRGCASCDNDAACLWCGVYGYLEHGRHGAAVEYLCEVAREKRAYLDRLRRDNRRFYRIADITVQVEADLPIGEHTFHAKFDDFEVDGPGPDTVVLRHHFGLPDLSGQDLGELVYRRSPWAIYRRRGQWIYLGIAPDDDDPELHGVAVFNDDHTSGALFNEEVLAAKWSDAQFPALTLFPTDQIILARVLADRDGCFLHSGGVVVNDRGLLFVGHSTAGKSTTMKMFDGRADVLCDDRNVVRLTSGGPRVYGTWSHGEVPIVSAADAPLHAIFFLRKATENRLVRIEDRRTVVKELLGRVIKPMVTADWWEKTLTVVEGIARDVPCYEMHFDTSGAIVAELEEIARRDV